MRHNIAALFACAFVVAAQDTTSSTTSPSIPSTTTDAAGTIYSLYASSDSTHGSYTNASAQICYADCMTACDAESACTAFTYVGGTNGVGPGTCWLKTKLGSPCPAGANVVSGVKECNHKKLTILSAYYSTMDVTAMAQADFISGNELVIDTADLNTLFGNDPWYGVQKSLSILYQNDTTTRVFVTVERAGIYTLTPTSSPPNCADVITFSAPSNASIRIVSAVWGQAQSTVESVYDTLYDYASSKVSFVVSNSLFADVDTWYGTMKSAVIWYLTSSGTLDAITAREGDYAQFP